MNHDDQFIIFHSRARHLIRVRTLRFDDAPLLVDIFDHMTPDSRYRRFHQTLDHVSATRVRQESINIAQADPNLNWGLIAFANLPKQQNVPIGAVRLVRTKPNEAEVAISIRDDFQNMGIGSKLMHMLAEAAQKMGLQRLTADIQNDNPAIWHVFKSLPYHIARHSQGVYSNIVINLAPLSDETKVNWRG